MSTNDPRDPPAPKLPRIVLDPDPPPPSPEARAWRDRIFAAHTLAETVDDAELPPPTRECWDATRAERLAWYAAREARAAATRTGWVAFLVWFTALNLRDTPHAAQCAAWLALAVFDPPGVRPRATRMLSLRAVQVGHGVAIFRVLAITALAVAAILSPAPTARMAWSLAAFPAWFLLHRARLAGMALAAHYDPNRIPEAVVHDIARAERDRASGHNAPMPPGYDLDNPLPGNRPAGTPPDDA